MTSNSRLAVPELTRSVDIKLNKQVSLRRHEDRIPSYHRTFPPGTGPQWQSRQASAWRLCLKGNLALQIPANRPNRFSIICGVCEGLGITFEYAEGAPSSTPISCRHCGAYRGTLGDLRSLSALGKNNHSFEI
jgi:hypothetical protein